MFDIGTFNKVDRETAKEITIDDLILCAKLPSPSGKQTVFAYSAEIDFPDILITATPLVDNDGDYGLYLSLHFTPKYGTYMMIKKEFVIHCVAESAECMNEGSDMLFIEDFIRDDGLAGLRISSEFLLETARIENLWDLFSRWNELAFNILVPAIYQAAQIQQAELEKVMEEMSDIMEGASR